MKKFIYHLFLSVAMVAAFTACSDDDDPGYRLPQNLDGLNVSTISNGNTLSGVQTTYALGADGKTVTLTMRGTAAGSKAAEVPTIDPGYILPGCAEVTLTFTPKVEATYATGEGSGVSTFCTYNYRVTMTDASVTVEFKDIVMNNGLILSEITYTDADVDHMLELTYNGAPVIGKQVTYTPTANDYRNVKISVVGQSMDLSSIGDVLGNSIQNLPIDFSKLNDIKTPGVLPGTSTVEFNVTVNEDNQFSGQGETDFVTYKYNGTVSNSELSLNFTDVTLKDKSLAGTYNMKEFDSDNLAYYDLVRFEWESAKGLEIELFPGVNVEMPVLTVAIMTLGGFPLVNLDGTQVTVFEALATVLKSVTLGEDGTVTAEYADTKQAGLPITAAPAGLAQYVVTPDNKILLFLNPQAIIATAMAASNASKADANAQIFDQLITGLLPMIANGIPVSYGPALVPDPNAEWGNSNQMIESTDPNFVSFYLDTEFLLPILKTVSPLFNDETVVNSIVNAASKDPNMGTMAPMLPGILKSVPSVVESTTKVEIGLQLTKAAN